MMDVFPDFADVDIESVGRDEVIARLVEHGWPAARVGAMFRLSAHRVRQIAPVARAVAAIPRGPGALTIAEARSMLNDYRLDPYIRPADREAAEAWIRSQNLVV